APVMGFQGMR
uniref:Tachykinin-related peptide 5 n=2 Tax=Pentatomomorpha TaxID=33357 RepID=TRP5_ONCFA|nr:RecName: Full=Tachykinin-related peptide 5; Short=TKRP-5 [Oncopeltus fasciatus]P86598.1 RecName: Full=Tachykinin-related peptide 5; Short=TKRP-5 [Pyrrhocoris apterus]